MSQHNQSIESHVDSNVSMAIDQADEYGGIQSAIQSFSQNVSDSCLEDGYSGEEAMDAVGWFFKKLQARGIVVQ